MLSTHLPLVVFDPGAALGYCVVKRHAYLTKVVKVRTGVLVSTKTRPIERAIELTDLIVNLLPLTDPYAEIAAWFLDSLVVSRGRQSVVSQAMLMGAIATRFSWYTVDTISEMGARLQVTGKRSKTAVLQWARDAGVYQEGMTDHEVESILGARTLLPIDWSMELW